VVQDSESRQMTAPLSDDAMGWVDRISPRHVFEAMIQILLERDSTKLSLQGWVRNLSESGLGAFVADALIVGESVTLEIPLPDSDKQVVPAKVVWIVAHPGSVHKTTNCGCSERV
jgi:Tfp pilus assembly protein PilZ